MWMPKHKLFYPAYIVVARQNRLKFMNVLLLPKKTFVFCLTKKMSFDENVLDDIA